MVLHFIFGVMIHFLFNFCVRYEVQVKVNYFCMSISIVPTLFVEKMIIYPLNCHSSFSIIEIPLPFLHDVVFVLCITSTYINPQSNFLSTFISFHNENLIYLNEYFSHLLNISLKMQALLHSPLWQGVRQRGMAVYQLSVFGYMYRN